MTMKIFPKKALQKKPKTPYRLQFRIFWAHIWRIIIFFSIESACKFAANYKFSPVFKRSFSRECPMYELYIFIKIYSTFIHVA